MTGSILVRNRCAYAAFSKALTLIALCFALLLNGTAFAQLSAGSITAINGNATITRGGRSFPASYSTPINVGDEIATGGNGRLTVTLTDGSQLELTESSTLLVSQNLVNPNGSRSRTTITLLGGLVRSLVRVTAGTPPNYEVHTPNAVAAARGTTYDTYFTSNSARTEYKGCKEFTDVSVYDGTVLVSSLANPSSPSVELRSGQKTTVPCNQAVSEATALAVVAGGLGAGAIAGIAAGSVAVVTGGIVGGLVGVGGGPSPTPTPLPVTPIM
jgi:hypothetical protein